jgi:general stress protein 26
VVSVLEKIDGMKERFKEARLVYLTTFDEKEKKRRRPMTNYNKDPYDTMWFPTFKRTRKVEHIQRNPKVLVTFASEKAGEFYEIEGEAELAADDAVEEKWTWWLLSWLPDEEFNYRLTSDGPFTNHAIINVHPKSARIVVQPQPA